MKQILLMWKPQKDAANVLGKMEQVDGLLEQLIRLHYAYNIILIKRSYETTQIYGFGGDPMTIISVPSIKQFIAVIIRRPMRDGSDVYNKSLKKQDMP